MKRAIIFWATVAFGAVVSLPLGVLASGALGGSVGNGGGGSTSSSTGGGTIGGSIASTQVPYGSGTNTIAGESAFTYNSSTNLMTVDKTQSLETTLGSAGVQSGLLKMAGTTSGTVTIQPASAAGTWTMTLPTTAGSSSQYLQTNGSGVTTWATITGGTIGGTIASGQVAYGSGADTIAGESALQYDATNNRLSLGATSSYADFNVERAHTGTTFGVVANTNSAGRAGFYSTNNTPAGIIMRANGTTASTNANYGEIATDSALAGIMFNANGSGDIIMFKVADVEVGQINATQLSTVSGVGLNIDSNTLIVDAALNQVTMARGFVSGSQFEIDGDNTTLPTCAADGDVSRMTRYSKSAGATIVTCICRKVAGAYSLLEVGAGGVGNCT